MSTVSTNSSTKRSTNTMNKNDLLTILANIESQMSALRTIVDAIPDRKPRASKKSKAADVPPVPAPSPAPADNVSVASSASKPKREINPQIVEYNRDRNRIFNEMRAAWLVKHPALADMARAAWVDLPETADKAAKKEHNKAVRAFKDALKTRNVDAPPTYPDALKEHSQRLKAAKTDVVGPISARLDGTMAAPVAPPAEKPAKKSSKKSSATAPVVDSTSVASTTEPTKKRRGRPAMTDQQKADAKAARKAAKKAAKKAATLPPLPSSPPESDSLDTDSDSDSGSASD